MVSLWTAQWSIYPNLCSAMSSAKHVCGPSSSCEEQVTFWLQQHGFFRGEIGHPPSCLTLVQALPCPAQVELLEQEFECRLAVALTTYESDAQS